MFVIHQNRDDAGRGKDNCIHEKDLPKFLVRGVLCRVRPGAGRPCSLHVRLAGAASMYLCFSLGWLLRVCVRVCVRVPGFAAL
jgi:hypothetical protein